MCVGVGDALAHESYRVKVVSGWKLMGTLRAILDCAYTCM